MLIIQGRTIQLRPAIESDRKKIYEWLAHSDLTPSMMGPPDYPDGPVPTWDEFSSDYHLDFFNDSGNGHGRNFIILSGDEAVGTVGYDCTDMKEKRTFLDIWLAEERYCRKGYGSDALKTLCRYLFHTYGIVSFIISPSERNKRAIAAYEKAGFVRLQLDPEEQLEKFGRGEYRDNIIMEKRMEEPA